MTKTFKIYQCLLKGIVCISAAGSGHFSQTAFASEDALRALYTEAGTFVDAMVVDAGTLRLEEGEHFFEQSEKNYAALLTVQASIHADEKKIRKMSDWHDDLSIKLAKNLVIVTKAYGSVSTAKARQGAINIGPEIREVCDALLVDVEPTLAVMRPILASTHLYSDEQKEAIAPHMAVIKNKVAHYNLLVKNEMINYRVVAGKYDKRREKLGKHLWRFVHAFEDLNNEKERALVSEALVNETGLPGQAFLTAQEWVFKDTYIYTRASECPSNVGIFPHIVPFPNHVDHLSNYITRPYEEFDEKKNFLPRPPKKGDTTFERVANALSHRQVQLYNLEKVTDKLSDELSKQTAIVRDVLSSEADMAQALDDIDMFMRAFRPESDIQSELRAAKRDLDSELEGANRAYKRVLDERAAIKNAQDANKTIRVKETISGSFEIAKPNSSHKTVAEWQEEFERRKSLITKSREGQETVMANTYWRNNQTSMDAREALENEIQRLKSIEADYDGKIEAVRAVEQAKPIDQSKLRGAEKAEEAARERVSVLRKTVKRLENDFATRRTPDGLITDRSETLSQLDASRADWRKSANADVIAAINKIDFSTGARLDADASVEGLSSTFRDLQSAHKALLAQVDQERSKLTALLGRARGLDAKKHRLVNSLVNTKLAAVRAVQLKFEGAEGEKQTELLEHLDAYKKNLKNVQTILGQTSGVLGKPETLVGYMDTINSVYHTGKTISLGEFGKRMATANKYVGQVASAAATLESGITKASKLTKALTLPQNNTPAASFAHIQDVLGVAELGMDGLPVVGAVSGVYFIYLTESVRVISEKAEFIRATTFNKIMHDGNYNPPERHLYTLAELQNANSDHAVFLRWARTGGQAVTEDLQVKRVLFLLSPKSINDACDQPLSKNSSDPYGKKTCTQQGKIQ